MKIFKHILFSTLFILILLVTYSCTQKAENTSETKITAKPESHIPVDSTRFDIYADYTLTADLSHFSDNQKQMIGLLIDASEVMDDLFWQQSFGDKNALLNGIQNDAQRRFAKINYGPWDRLDNNKPFVAGFSEKPLGAQFYPPDMTSEEFESWDEPNKKDQYSLVKRNANGELELVPYHIAFKPQLEKAATLLEAAAELAEDEGFKQYLKLRAKALITDKYQESDMAWMDMKTNSIDVVIGAIENYEDALFGYRNAFESYVLIKDLAWSKRLEHYVQFLPELQNNLPVEQKYKEEKPGTDSDLNAYDLVYTAGHCHAGSKTIAINLPNDEEVQLSKGTRRLQLKNAMQAKFDNILVPLAETLIVPEQRKHITFNAFFSNTMFHEVAHGLGIKNTINGKGYVREALKEAASPLEEGKADILGLYMINALFEKGEIADGELMDYYTTFLAGIFRSVRFGASSAHGKANMVRFNYFEKEGAFTRNEEGHYSVNFDNMQTAVQKLSADLLHLQGNGDYEGAVALLENMGVVSDVLQADLQRLTDKNIPVDVEFIKGKDVLGL